MKESGVEEFEFVPIKTEGCQQCGGSIDAKNKVAGVLSFDEPITDKDGNEIMAYFRIFCSIECFNKNTEGYEMCGG